MNIFKKRLLTIQLHNVKDQGFTLVEVLIILLILSVLSAVII
ncbi:prepilin-type N-terminal cleavage/methylation domain-containing protein, partial [Chloroflexota bacterium]